MGNFYEQILQMKMVIAYWTRQAESFVTGYGEKEPIEIALDLKQLTELKIRQDQRRLLDIFQESEGTCLDRLRVIYCYIGERFEQIICEASADEQQKYELLLDDVYENLSMLEVAIE